VNSGEASRQREDEIGMADKKSKMDPKRFEVANRIFFRLYQAQNLVHKNGTRYMIELGSTTQQWAVLGALARPPVCEAGMTVKELIAYLLLSRQNLTAVIDRLEERGWVDRVKDDDDGRSRRIRLTKEGNKIWARMLPIIDDFYSAALAGLDDKERAELYRLLNKLKETLGEI
jgi:DNA-binding MarR family transcriptional regulator